MESHGQTIRSSDPSSTSSWPLNGFWRPEPDWAAYTESLACNNCGTPVSALAYVTATTDSGRSPATGRSSLAPKTDRRVAEPHLAAKCLARGARAAWHGQPPLVPVPIVAGRRGQLGRDRRCRPLLLLPQPAESRRCRREKPRNVKSSSLNVHFSLHWPPDPENMGRPGPRCSNGVSLCRHPTPVPFRASRTRTSSPRCNQSVHRRCHRAGGGG